MIKLFHEQGGLKMGRRIIVAGLGHGGIAAAALLSKAGFDVTVYEKKAEGTLGYDWTDIFAPSSLDAAGIEMPPEEKFEYKEDMTFFAPTSKKSLQQHIPKEQLEIKMERRDIYDHLITNALNCGVDIVYGCEISSPIILGNRVAGISTDKGDFYGDLIIDACGLNSPLRRNLPDAFGIDKEVLRKDKISIYRAFYNIGSDEKPEAKFKVMLFPDNIRGIGWIASEEKYTDLLIGRFEDFDLAEVERFSDELRKSNPRLGKERVRGGQFVEIPVRQPLAVMVADGYAAIGDSAFMTVPMIGSGIANSLRAARCLADAVISDSSLAYSAETLWKYQVSYYHTVGAGLAPIACAKNMALTLKPAEIDYLFESETLTSEDINMGADFTSLASLMSGVDFKSLGNKAKQVCRDKELLRKILNCGTDMGKVAATCAVIPKKWNKDRVFAWAKLYNFAFK